MLVAENKLKKVKFWMRKYGHETLKRTHIVTNSSVLAKLNVGKLLPTERQCSVKTYNKYHNAKGKECYEGSTDLKRGQPLYSAHHSRNVLIY